MANKMKECLYCGAKFYAIRNSKVYCSHRCGVLYNQRLYRRKFEPRKCIVCGEEYIPYMKTQVTCRKPECIKGNKNSRENYKSPYRYSKWEGLPLPERKKLKEKLTDAQWNALSASERWELMNLTELSGEIARMFPGKSFAQVRLLKEQGTLPEDFGKRTENNG